MTQLAVTPDELITSIDEFIEKECEKRDGHLIHKNCGGTIRNGFLNLFYLNDDQSLDPGIDGFGIGPKKVPYCEICFPPDGYNHTYAVRFPMLRERKKDQQDYQFFWGNRELTAENQRLLLE